MSSIISSVQAAAELRKPKRTDVVKIPAVSIKPPSVIPDADGGDKHTYTCTYVSSAFQQVEKPCTFSVWKRCEGRRVTGQPQDGLDIRLHNDFVMIVDKHGIVVDVDVIPKVYYSSKAILPDDLTGKRDIVIKFISNQGAMEVTQCPAGVTKAGLMSLMNAVDKVDSITTGDTLPGGFEVLSVSGTTVSFSPPSGR